MERVREVDGVTRLKSPNYREAYPCFDVLKCAAGRSKGRNFCIFSLGKPRMGHLEVRKVLNGRNGPAWLIGKQQIIGAREYLGYNEGPFEFHLKAGPSGVDGVRRYVLCPGCQQRKLQLYWKGKWKCAKCHGLLLRSQAIDKGTLLMERADLLSAEIGSGRPKGMHSSKYLAKVAELEELRSRLADRRVVPVASREHSLIITSKWVTAEEDQEWEAGMSLDWKL